MISIRKCERETARSSFHDDPTESQASILSLLVPAGKPELDYYKTYISNPLSNPPKNNSSHLLQLPQLPRLNKFLLNPLPPLLSLMNPPLRLTLLPPRLHKLKLQLRNMTPINPHHHPPNPIHLLLTLPLPRRQKTHIRRPTIRLSPRLIFVSNRRLNKSNPFIDMY